MNDPTEAICRQRLVEFNLVPGCREALEAEYGQVWDTSQLAADFEVTGFMAPLVVVRRRSDGVKGSLEFQHSPRFYFSFQPTTRNEAAMPISEKTWEQALHSQSACNLSGLAHFLVRVLDELRANSINSTDALNMHPIVRLVAAQMAHLAYSTFHCGAGNLWQRAYQLAEIETGRHPYHDRPLEPGEKERILVQWAEEDRQAAGKGRGA